ncbi:hypothetical protein BH09PLA1_BH09PLA1_30170 [soil metagenome]
MTKLEIRSPKEVRTTKSEIGIRTSVIHSGFWFRISSFPGVCGELPTFHAHRMLRMVFVFLD